jgi:hypothetical protein
MPNFQHNTVLDENPRLFVAGFTSHPAIGTSVAKKM